jgi:hypothetical protein
MVLVYMGRRKVEVPDASCTITTSTCSILGNAARMSTTVRAEAVLPGGATSMTAQGATKANFPSSFSLRRQSACHTVASTPHTGH